MTTSKGPEELTIPKGESNAVLNMGLASNLKTAATLLSGCQDFIGLASMYASAEKGRLTSSTSKTTLD